MIEGGMKAPYCDLLMAKTLMKATAMTFPCRVMNLTDEKT